MVIYAEVKPNQGFKISEEKNGVVVRKVKFSGNTAIFIADEHDSKTKWSDIETAKQNIIDRFGKNVLFF